MDHLQIAILGLVQGLTEFLPISSSAHLILFPKFLGWVDQGLDVDAFLHLGTLAAVLLYFRKDLWALLFDRSQHKLALGILLATLPAVIIGFTFKDFIGGSALLRSFKFCGVTLIIGGLVLWYFDRYSAKTRSITELKTWQVFFIGLMQAVALMPGVSRSGATMIGGLSQGLTREAAARFAFLIGVPAIAGAGLLAVKDMLEASTSPDFVHLGIGFISSFISGYFAIDFLIGFLQKRSLTVFVVYRVILGLILLAL